MAVYPPWSRISFNLEQFLSLLLSFIALIFLKNKGQLFCRMFFNLSLFEFLLVQIQSMHFCQECYVSGIVLFAHCIILRGMRCQFVPILLRLNLNTWLKWGLPSSIVKWTFFFFFFAFVINKWSMRRYFETM